MRIEYLEEHEAWAYLARKWSRPVTRKALCKCIRILCNTKQISEHTACKMSSRIYNKYGQYFSEAPVWPLTKAGAKQRAKFCRRMAKETKPT